jgi:hypothetical protein
LLVSGERDDFAANSSNTGQHDIQFIGFTAVGKRQKYVVGADLAQVAVHGFNRMQKERPGSGTVQGRNDFTPDNTRLADSTDNYTTLGIADQVDHLGKILVEVINQIEYTFGLYL